MSFVYSFRFSQLILVLIVYIVVFSDISLYLFSQSLSPIFITLIAIISGFSNRIFSKIKNNGNIDSMKNYKGEILFAKNREGLKYVTVYYLMIFAIALISFYSINNLSKYISGNNLSVLTSAIYIPISILAAFFVSHLLDKNHRKDFWFLTALIIGPLAIPLLLSPVAVGQFTFNILIVPVWLIASIVLVIEMTEMFDLY